ncbi:putative entry exclusion protein TrbK-alt [Sphingopyxis sp. YR583]|uniref:putative entry exclusion protein TrbK-alt n=1 Tax=Sphingopyxis sp. YR583 TaxID=1881047 RepID=UPI0015A6051C|nr:putative entry exclusion protein TrbK-alt [Sphingopyxis sp. YR583]
MTDALDRKAAAPKAVAGDRRPKQSRIPSGTGALAIAIAAALLVTGGLIALRDPVPPTHYAVTEQTPPAKPRRDPLAADLAHCRTATSDEDGVCQAVWDAHRKRFLGSRRAAPDQPHTAAER